MTLATHPLQPQDVGARRADRARGARSAAYRMPLSRLARRARTAVSTLVLAVAVLSFLGLAVGPHVFGYRTVTMLTGSMAPMINPGDVVISVPKPASEVAVGDVLTYEIPVQDKRVETHRVVELTTDVKGRPVILTKGDANSDVDPWLATIEGETVWETRAVVPWVGSAIRSLRQPLVHGVLLWGSVGALVLVGLWQIWTPGRSEGDD